MFLKLLYSHFLLQRCFAHIFLRRAFSESLRAVIYRALSELAQVFSLFIPLKILIIMGSEDIPIYLQGYISEETRTIWLLSMTAATFFLYFLAIFLGLLSHRMVVRGGLKFNFQQIYPSQEHQKKRQGLKRVYKLSLNAYTNLLIILVGFLLLLVVNPLIALLIPSFIVFQIMLANSLICREAGFLSWLGRSMKKEPVEYLNYFSAINFLLVFMILVFDYLLDGQINTVAAIFTLLLSRRTFQAIKQYGAIAIKLSEDGESLQSLQRLDSTM